MTHIHIRAIALLLVGIIISIPTTTSASLAASVLSPYLYNFNAAGVLKEAGSENDSSSPYWWVNSGGYLLLKDGVGKTVQGNLATADPMRLAYASANPQDTDNGHHPQNIFRLLSRSTWQDAETSVRFKINDTILSDTPNRDGYSGLLLMTRYSDGDNLYYAGIRQDGNLVIKKKVNGTYHTLAQKPFWTKPYDKYKNPNNIPEDKWLGLKVVTENVSGGVKISLAMDKDGSGSYTTHLVAIDDGIGGPAHTKAGFSGIRSDYMDMEFENFRQIAR